MYKEEDIYEFVFQTFDKDCSGNIDEEEFLDLARTVNNAEVCYAFVLRTTDALIYGVEAATSANWPPEKNNYLQPLFPGNFKTALEQFDQNDDGLIDFVEFKQVRK
mgnify:CR=1 FL=1